MEKEKNSGGLNSSWEHAATPQHKAKFSAHAEAFKVDNLIRQHGRSSEKNCFEADNFSRQDDETADEKSSVVGTLSPKDAENADDKNQFAANNLTRQHDENSTNKVIVNNLVCQDGGNPEKKPVLASTASLQHDRKTKNKQFLRDDLTYQDGENADRKSSDDQLRQLDGASPGNWSPAAVSSRSVNQPERACIHAVTTATPASACCKAPGARILEARGAAAGSAEVSRVGPDNDGAAGERRGEVPLQFDIPCHDPEARIWQCIHPPVITVIDEDHVHGVSVELREADLWQQFHSLHTEMIITKLGRRMFPTFRINIRGLKEDALYHVTLEFAQCSANKYRYSYPCSRWTLVGKGEGEEERIIPGNKTYSPSVSPVLGATLMAQAMAFERVKLSNSWLAASPCQVVLQSMQMFQPVVHIQRTGNDAEPPAARMSFVFPQTSFMAVTAYQNQQITNLKIAKNPFAKGFRPEASKSKSPLPGQQDVISAPYFAASPGTALHMSTQDRRPSRKGPRRHVHLASASDVPPGVPPSPLPQPPPLPPPPPPPAAASTDPAHLRSWLSDAVFPPALPSAPPDLSFRSDHSPASHEAKHRPFHSPIFSSPYWRQQQQHPPSSSPAALCCLNYGLPLHSPAPADWSFYHHYYLHHHHHRRIHHPHPGFLPPWFSVPALHPPDHHHLVSLAPSSPSSFSLNGERPPLLSLSPGVDVAPGPLWSDNGLSSINSSSRTPGPRESHRSHSESLDALHALSSREACGHLSSGRQEAHELSSPASERAALVPASPSGVDVDPVLSWSSMRTGESVASTPSNRGALGPSSPCKRGAGAPASPSGHESMSDASPPDGGRDGHESSSSSSGRGTLVPSSPSSYGTPDSPGSRNHETRNSSASVNVTGKPGSLTPKTERCHAQEPLPRHCDGNAKNGRKRRVRDDEDHRDQLIKVPGKLRQYVIT